MFSFKTGFVLIFLFSLFLYSLTLAQTPTGIADSDELASMGQSFKAAHPPGYPLYMAIIFGVDQIVFGSFKITAAHGLSAIFMALANAVFFLLLLELFKHLWPKEGILNNLISGAGAIMAGTLIPIWIYASITEVFALHIFYCLMAVYLSLAIRTNGVWGKKGFGRVMGLGTVIGLMLMHHQLSVLILPSLALILYPQIKFSWERRIWKPWGYGLGVGLLMLILQFNLLYLLLGRNQDWHWLSRQTIEGTWSYLTRSIYSGNRIEGGSSRSAYWFDININDFKSGIVSYLKEFFILYFGWLYLILMLTGIRLSYLKMERSLFWAFFSLAAVTGPLIAGYLGQAAQSDQSALSYLTFRLLSERMYLAGAYFMVIYIAIALIAGLVFVKHKYGVKTAYMAMAVFALAGIGVLPSKFISVRAITRSDWWQNLSSSMTALPKSSVIICLSDVSCFSSLYLQNTLKQRNDLTVIPVTPYLVNNYSIKSGYFGFPDNPFRLDDAIAKAFESGKRVFVFELNNFYRDYWMIGAGGMMARNDGLLRELGCFKERGTEIKSDSGKARGSRVLITAWRELWYLTQEISFEKQDACLYPKDRENNADECVKNGDLACGIKELYLALLFEPRKYELRIKLAKMLKEAGFLPLAKREFRIAHELDQTETEAWDQVQFLEKTNDLGLHQAGEMIFFFVKADNN